jgi:hypothetical protein
MNFSSRNKTLIWGSLIIFIGLIIAHFGNFWLSLPFVFAFPLAWYNTSGAVGERIAKMILLQVVALGLLLSTAWLSYSPIPSMWLEGLGLGLIALIYYVIAAYAIKTVDLNLKNMAIVFLGTALVYSFSHWLTDNIFDATEPMISAKRQSIQLLLILLSIHVSTSLAIEETAE